MTAAAHKGLVDIHDRLPLVLVSEAAREWVKQDTGGKEADCLHILSKNFFLKRSDISSIHMLISKK